MAAKLRAVMCWAILIAMVLSSLLLQAPLILRNSQVSNAACVCNSGAANGEAHFTEEQKPQENPQQQQFHAHGTAHYGFVQFSAYRQSPRTFFIVGITSVAVRDYTPPVQECEWKSSSGGGNNSTSSATAMAPAEMIYIRFDENGALFVPAIIKCSFPDPVGGDGLGGELSITLPAGARGGKTVTVLAMAEGRGAAASFFHSPAPRLAYAFCGPPMHSEVRAEWILHWLVYHHALWRQQAHFFFYNVGGLKPQQRRLFLPYIRAGVLTITDVAREADFPSWYYQQPLLANDCLHRSRFLADWTFFLDFDEFLHVPAPASLPSLLLLHGQAPWISFGSLPVSHSHCLDAAPDLDLWPVERMRWRHSAPECVHPDRDPWACVAAPGRRKYAVNPRAVFAAGVHRSALPEEGGVDLNASVARIHHYHGVLAPEVELCHHQVNLSHPPDHLDWLMPGFRNFVHDPELAALVSAARRAWLSSIPGRS